MRAVASIVGLAIGVLLLAGCTPARVALTPLASAAPPSASAAPSEAPAPVPSPVEAPIAATPTPQATPVQPEGPTVTCESLLDDATLARITDDASDGLGFREDYGQSMVDQGALSGRFVELGGVACLVGDLNVASDNAFVYGYSAIPDAEAQQIQLSLEFQGYEQSEQLGGTVYCEFAEGDVNDCYLFESGEWFHTNFPDQFGMLVNQVRAA